MKITTEEQMLHAAASYCSTSEHCISEVEEKIKSAGFDTSVSERIIQRLTEEHFIDETRYADSFVNDKFRFNKWGRLKISRALQMKRIPERVISQSLHDKIDEAEYETTLRDLMDRKLQNIHSTDGMKLMASLVSFAASRGFEQDMIMKCMNDIINHRSNDEGDETDPAGGEG